MRSVASRLLPQTLRGRVAVVLNGTLFVLFALFIAYDYSNDSADRLELKRTSLQEQAEILMPGVRGKQHPEDISGYLAETRKQMESTHSDTHVVASEIGGQFYHSGTPPEADEGIARKLQETATGSPFVEVGGRVFMVGRHQEGTTVVYVAEDLQDVHAAIRADLKRHLVAVAFALLCGIVTINVTLWMAFQRPLSILTGAAAEIGSGKLGVQIERMGTVEFDILATAINDMSRALDDVESARSAQMRKARLIQDSLHPAQMLLDGVTIAHHFQPAEMVAGDYYDLLMLTDGSRLFCIADVTGHGVSAALVAAMVKVCLLNAIEHSCDPGEILRFVNRRLSAMDLPEMFVSMLLVRFCREPARLEFAGAGHPPALLVNEVLACRELKSEGPLLGIGLDFLWTTRCESFAPGDRLFLYTDGLTEASAGNHSQYGLARVKESLLATRNLPPAQAVKAIVQRLGEFCDAKAFLDDVTLVLAEPRASTAS